jgi:adenylate cyclase
MPERRYAAIVCVDVVGSSRLMEADEAGTLAAINALLSRVIRPAVSRHRGRLVKTTGDGALIEFASPVEAVACGVHIQKASLGRAARQPEERRLLLRIGINLGDIVVGDDGDLYGDDVNVAVRLEPIADPGGICISRKVREELRGKLDLLFEDRGEHVLKNISRPVHVFTWAATEQPARPRTPLILPGKPSIAVLPFRNLNQDSEQDYLADGIVEDILTALGRLRWLFVSARSATFTYKGQAADPKRVGADLGVRYVLQGSLRRSGTRLRLTSRLVEAETGNQIWADCYDRAIEDIFELQDKLTTSVAGAIEPRLQHAEIERARGKAPQDLDSYERFLRALALMYECTRASLEHALALVDTTIAKDPGYAQPYALGAWICMYRVAQGWVEDKAREGARGVGYARNAIEREREDATALWMAASAFGFLARDIQTSRLLLDRAIALNPSCAPAFWMSGWVHCWTGHLREAIDHLDTAIRLSPIDRTMVAAESGLALAYCMDGQFESSMVWARKAIANQPSWAASYRPLAASLALTDRLEEARAVAAEILAFEPGYRISGIRSLYSAGPGAARYLEGLARAGLPE